MKPSFDFAIPSRLRPKGMLRKLLVALAGGTLLLLGVAMLVLPGPAVVVIPAALAILAIEFEWPRRWLASLRARFKRSACSKPAD